jgi:hypothetical protein
VGVRIASQQPSNQGPFVLWKREEGHIRHEVESVDYTLKVSSNMFKMAITLSCFVCKQKEGTCQRLVAILSYLMVTPHKSLCFAMPMMCSMGTS